MMRHIGLAPDICPFVILPRRFAKRCRDHAFDILDDIAILDIVIGITRRGVRQPEDRVPLDVARQWLARIASAAAAPELATALPAYAYAQVLMAHPFSAGNGRFARLMIHAALARCAGLDLPAIALAPAFYRQAGSMGRALTRLSNSGDWGPFYDTFLTVLETAVRNTEALAQLPSN